MVECGDSEAARSLGGTTLAPDGLWRAMVVGGITREIYRLQISMDATIAHRWIGSAPADLGERPDQPAEPSLPWPRTTLMGRPLKRRLTCGRNCRNLECQAKCDRLT
jgi:hypothetical protein